MAVWTVTELEPLSRFVWEARILGSRFAGAITSRPGPPACTTR
ncbi:MAG TPA: hypothetical protein VFY88_01115 [Intrasporangium sp.]|nr:hypothetical protein [Intrasporangium sp.]